ncbi:mariner Mos1 transposase [Trichonephila clavipes]|nr:mariner Mos1 transposase [Trichonephila clavipes]
MSTEDDARSGHPKEAVTDENIKKVHKIIFDNRKVKLIEIAETLKISKERVGKTINNDYYVALLERLKDEIAEKRPHVKKKKVLFHQDNAPCHKSMNSMTKLHELGFELLLHPPYNPDLAPSDFFLFSDLKKRLAGQKFCADEEVIAETEANFKAEDKLYYKNGIEKLYGCYNRCIALKGNYIE